MARSKQNKKNTKTTESSENTTNEIKKKLELIKKLLIRQLIQNGVSYDDVAGILKINPKTLYRYFPKKKISNQDKKK